MSYCTKAKSGENIIEVSHCTKDKSGENLIEVSHCTEAYHDGNILFAYDTFLPQATFF